MDFFRKGSAYDFGLKFQISSEFLYSQIGPRNHVWWCFKVKSKWFWSYSKMSNLCSRHLGFFPIGLVYEFGSKFQFSLNFVYGQIEPGNDVCWCFNATSKWFWQNMNVSNFISGHFGFVLKGVSYDFGSKIQISSEFLYSQIRPRNHVWLCFRVKLKWLWRYLRISYFISRHLGYFSKGVRLWLWVKTSNFFKLCI